MYTTVAFYESIDPAGAWANLAAIADQHVYTQGDDLTVPSLSQIVALSAGVCSGGDVLARVVSPTLRGLAYNYIHAVNGVVDADCEPEVIPMVDDRRRSPLKLSPNEQLEVEIHSNPTAAQAQWVIVCLADGAISPVSGEIFTIRAVNTDTLTADAWTNGNLTLDQDLPPGKYQLVGLRALSAGLVAVRAVPRGGRWRPGSLGCDTADDKTHDIFRLGNMGVMCEFTNLDIPSMDFLSISTDSDQEVFMDLIKVG